METACRRYQKDLDKMHDHDYTSLRIIRRTGHVRPFNADKIAASIRKAFLAIAGDKPDKELADRVDKVTQRTLRAVWEKHEREHGPIYVEDVQDQVELSLARCGYSNVCEAFSQYREHRAEERRKKANTILPDSITLIESDGSKQQIDPSKLHRRLEAVCSGLEDNVSVDTLLKRVVASLHDGITKQNYYRALILEAATLIEKNHNYSKVAARLLLGSIFEEVVGKEFTRAKMDKEYVKALPKMLKTGEKIGRINPRLRLMDLERLSEAIRPERDDLFEYLGLQTLYDRYLLRDDAGKCIELPQIMFMRVAMGLALKEKDPTERAIEFYDLLSSFKFMSSTPTLFNSGTVFNQLSSCYLSTVPDDLDGIYGAIKDNALLSKFSGGLGNDWSQVRSMGSYIKGTGGGSQGVIPFLRVVNDTAVAVNQGGKRKGAVCCYLETWHADIEEFLDLRKNTGDERRRTHDMNTANWIPDLFMMRVIERDKWTLFSPHDVPDLHDLYGREFNEQYEEYEKQVEAGLMFGRQVEAFDLWKDMITMLYETGHPWITFKDPCNIGSPQRGVGVVHSSNLCTEITLNTKSGSSDAEIAVCNLGSVNLVKHMRDDGDDLSYAELRKTVRVAMRMLDNVIDINFYAVPAAERSNKKHRPVGLGMAGLQDALHIIGIPFDSEPAMNRTDHITEAMCYYAYEASSDLAEERGRYESFDQSAWARGEMPHQMRENLIRERGKEEYVDIEQSSLEDWDTLREKIKRQGMRNSNCVAIAPTATISNIMGVSPCIEPDYKILYVKSNLSGEFTIVNRFFMDEMIKRELWTDDVISAIKTNDGEINGLECVPKDLQERFKTSFFIDQKRLIEGASRRQKWIDQSQSLNLFMHGKTGRDISDIYIHAWKKGLKTTYYCRSQSATTTEKFTTNTTGELNNVAVTKQDPAECKLDNECDVCQ